LVRSSAFIGTLQLERNGALMSAGASSFEKLFDSPDIFRDA